MSNLIGAVVREPIASGEPMVERKVVKGGEGGYLAVVLQPGMRAIGVPVSVESGAGGFILPGDRVDFSRHPVADPVAGCLSRPSGPAPKRDPSGDPGRGRAGNPYPAR